MRESLGYLLVIMSMWLKQESHAVAGEPRDADVNLDTYHILQ